MTDLVEKTFEDFRTANDIALKANFGQGVTYTGFRDDRIWTKKELQATLSR